MRQTGRSRCLVEWRNFGRENASATKCGRDLLVSVREMLVSQILSDVGVTLNVVSNGGIMSTNGEVTNE